MNYRHQTTKIVAWIFPHGGVDDNLEKRLKFNIIKIVVIYLYKNP